MILSPLTTRIRFFYQDMILISLSSSCFWQTISYLWSRCVELTKLRVRQRLTEYQKMAPYSTVMASRRRNPWVGLILVLQIKNSSHILSRVIWSYSYHPMQIVSKKGDDSWSPSNMHQLVLQGNTIRRNIDRIPTNYRVRGASCNSGGFDDLLRLVNVVGMLPLMIWLVKPSSDKIWLP